MQSLREVKDKSKNVRHSPLVSDENACDKIRRHIQRGVLTVLFGEWRKRLRQNPLSHTTWCTDSAVWWVTKTLTTKFVVTYNVVYWQYHLVSDKNAYDKIRCHIQRGVLTVLFGEWRKRLRQNPFSHTAWCTDSAIWWVTKTLTTKFVTLSLPQPVKCPGWKMHGSHLQTVHFTVLQDIFFQCYTFWRKSSHMPMPKEKEKGLRISDFAL